MVVEEAPVLVEVDCDVAAHEMMVLVAALGLEAEIVLNFVVLQIHFSPKTQHCSMDQAVPTQPGEEVDAVVICRNQQDCPFQL